MKILIVGNKGLLGHTFESMAIAQGHEVTGVDIESIDIVEYNSVASYFENKTFDWVVNCAAYTNVDGAETEKELAMAINAKGPKNLAQICKEKDIRLIHVSTDMIFTEGEFDETATPNPVNYYGVSKLAGEKALQETYPDGSWIVRTEWLYSGVGDKQKGFVNKVIEWASARDEISIVTDEAGVPTLADDLSSTILVLIENNEQYNSGIYHGVNEGNATRYELAREILQILDLKTVLKEGKLSDFARPAQVSHKSFLVNTKISKLRHWKEALKWYIDTKAKIK